MRRSVGILTAATISALAGCGGDGTLPFDAAGDTTVEDVSTTVEVTATTEESAASTADDEGTEAPGTTADVSTSAADVSTTVTGSTVAAGTTTLDPSVSTTVSVSGDSTTVVVPIDSTTTVPVSLVDPTTTLVPASVPPVAESTTVPVAPPVAESTTVPVAPPVAESTTVPVAPPMLDQPAVFVDVGSTGGLEDVGAGAAPTVEQVVTELAPGPMLVPAGARVLDRDVRVIAGADPNQPGTSARTDGLRMVVASSLPLETLSARLRDALAFIGAQPTETPLPAPQVGTTITAPPSPTAPGSPAWTVSILADEAHPGRWVIEVQRQHPAFPVAPDQLPAIVATPLAPATSLLGALSWTVDGWEFRSVVDDATGAVVTTRRLAFVTGVADLNEAATALAAAIPGSQRTDFDGAVEIIAPDGAKWALGGTDPNGQIRGTVELNG